MTSNVQSDRQSIGARTLTLLFLLALSVFINYVDRGNLSVAAPLLKGELHLSAYHLGLLLGAFFWTYVTFMIVSGWLIDCFDVNWVLAGGFAIWSLATGLTGLVHGFATLMACRLLLGVGERLNCIRANSDNAFISVFIKKRCLAYAEHPRRDLSGFLEWPELDNVVRFGPFHFLMQLRSVR